MLEKKYRNIIYFITLSIVATIFAQIYWNVKNYEINKQQIINQIQESFDDAVEKYFTEQAKKYIINDKKGQVIGFRKSIIHMEKNRSPSHIPIQPNIKPDVEILKMINGDSSTMKVIRITNDSPVSVFDIGIDSMEVKKLTTKIMVSLKNKDINLKEIDSLFNDDLSRKKIVLRYGLKFDYKSKSLLSIKNRQEYNLDNFPKEYLSAFSHSPYVGLDKLELRYATVTVGILKRMIGSIVLSFLLSGIIIGCLLFLLKIISNQKQLSEIKNDLISNITHEFKTPISTVMVALEGLQNFDVINNPTKTKEYFDVSNTQLGKLNAMVEKLLETATLRKSQFYLNKEPLNVDVLLKNCIERCQLISPDMDILYSGEVDVFVNVDKFHFENVINNILENAIKYGKSKIKVTLDKDLKIYIEDNGNGIPKNQQEKIFEQFYRIASGNVHNIKGFGIGLYYARKIIEKHGGVINVFESKKGKTVFEIKLENE